MTWTHLKFGTMLTENRDGTLKVRPKLWSPERATFAIPPVGQSHARPFVQFEGPNNAFPLRLLFFPDRIGGVHQGNLRTLVALGDASNDPEHWAGAVQKLAEA